uniref:Uncharacterized protein n=1 Tax=Trichuris muris TaxID=70415 RepID=A0A5S6QSH9_TRIMR
MRLELRRLKFASGPFGARKLRYYIRARPILFPAARRRRWTRVLRAQLGPSAFRVAICDRRLPHGLVLDALFSYHSPVATDATARFRGKRLCHWLPDKRRLLKAVEKWLSIKVSTSRLPADPAFTTGCSPTDRIYAQ